MDVVLIPAYEPDNKLIELTKSLSAKGFSVLVVNDGSGYRYDNIFKSVSEKATVISLDKNCGKGAALKHGMKHIKENMPECDYFITCDADGQHKPEDVARVCEKLHSGNNFVLTVRKQGRKTPLRSKVGNTLSRFVYTLLANKYLSDNQSGLRGFCVEYIDWLLMVEKDNYDYEMNVLYYAAKKSIEITTLPIEAIYIENNASSHFKPVSDTVKIYKSLFTRSFGSFISLILCEITVLIFSLTVGSDYLFISIPISGAVNCSSNILLNKFVFFKKTTIYDYWNMLVYKIIYYFSYTLGCLIFKLAIPEITLFIAFNIVFLICIPLRYYLHKAIYIGSQTRE